MSIQDEEKEIIIENNEKTDRLKNLFLTVTENLRKEINPDPDLNQLSHIYRIAPTQDAININKGKKQ